MVARRIVTQLQSISIDIQNENNDIDHKVIEVLNLLILL